MGKRKQFPPGAIMFDRGDGMAVISNAGDMDGVYRITQILGPVRHYIRMRNFRRLVKLARARRPQRGIT